VDLRIHGAQSDVNTTDGSKPKALPVTKKMTPDRRQPKVK
jgi:hypothetical protein